MTPEVGEQPRFGGEENVVPASETLSESDGLSVSTPQGEVGVVPVTAGSGTRVDSGVMLFPDERTNTVMTSSHDTVAAAGYMVIPGADAPTQYRFSLTANNALAELELTGRGGVLIQPLKHSASNN